MQKKMNQFSSIDELSTDNDCDDGYISKNALEEIKDGSKMHPLINVRDYRLKKYVTILNKHRVNGNVHNSQQRGR